MPASGVYSVLGVNANMARDMFTELSGVFAQRRSTYVPQYKSIATTLTTGSRTQRFDWAECLAQTREFIGELQFDTLKAYDYSLSVREWSSALKWKRDELSDDQTGMIRLGIDNFVNNFLQTPDTMMYRFINNHIAGTTTEFGVGFDGLATFSASHTWGAGVTYTTNQSNLLTGSNTGKLDLTYGYDNLQSAYLKLTSGFFYPWSDGSTGRIQQRPTHILCSSSVYFNCLRLLHSAEVQSGSTATYGLPASNVLQEMNLIPVLCPGLTAGYWVMCDLSTALRFMVFLDRRDFELDFQGPGSWAWFNNRLAMTSAWHRYNIGSGLWYTAVAGDGT